MFRTWSSALSRRVSSARAGTTRPRPSVRPRLEGLEERAVPAVSVFLSGRTLVAQGDARGNVIRLDNAGPNTVLAGVAVANSRFDAVLISPGNGNNAILVTGTVKPTTMFLGGGRD